MTKEYILTILGIYISFHIYDKAPNVRETLTNYYHFSDKQR